MFTGIIKEVGNVSLIKNIEEGLLLEIKSNDLINELDIDDSVSVNGCCQTVIEKGNDFFKVQAVHTTLMKSNFKDLGINDSVNLELPLRLSDKIDGHLVQGHVNCTGTLEAIEGTGENYNLTIKVPREQMKYIINEGSIALDGISLTVSHILSEVSFQVTIIPHTWNNTNLKNKKIGDKINIEVDMLAKYIEKLSNFR